MPTDVARTYGTYTFMPAGTTISHPVPYGTWDEIVHHDEWRLTCEPAVAMRAKRTFARARPSRAGALTVRHTIEVARDLEWFIDRFPLAPGDRASVAKLTTAAAEHRAKEKAVAEIALGHRRPHLPRTPVKTPRDYQLAAVEQLRTVKRLLLTDEVGLGKTLSAALSLCYADALPAVVVPLTHLPSRWVDECRESMPWLNVAVAKKGTPYSLADKKTGVEPDVIVIPYSRLAGWVDHLVENVKVKTVIFDEVQDLRTGQGTQKGTAAGRLADNATYVLGCTATPVYNYGGEVWNILNIIAPGVLGSRTEFTTEWAQYTLTNGQIKVADPAALGNYLREQGVMLGRTRKEVGRELPKTIKVAQQVPSDNDTIAAAAHDARAMARMILEGAGTRLDRFQAAGQIDMIMRQATGVAKAPYVAEFVRMLLESEDKLVLFGWHRDVYDVWLNRLAEFHPAMYTGSESPKQKDEALRTFYDDPSCRVLIMSLRSGAGTDGIQKVARTAVFGELDWSPQVHEQAIGRLRRDGMGAEPPVAYFLMTDSGSDPAIAEVLQIKRQQGEQVVSPDGRLFDNSITDVDRTRRLAEQILASTARKARRAA